MAIIDEVEDAVLDVEVPLLFIYGRDVTGTALALAELADWYQTREGPVTIMVSLQQDELLRDESVWDAGGTG